MADKVMATQLFKEGRALLDQGRVAPACRKLEESQRLDPGGGTLLNVALCHEREGRTATAWAEFTEALGIAKRDDRPQRVEFARAHLGVLEPVLSRLVIEVPNGSDRPDLEVKRDGVVVSRAAWGSPIPVDPGDHLVEAAAPGKLMWRQSVVMGTKSDAKTITVPTLDDAAVADVAPPSPVPAAHIRASTPPPEETESASPAKPPPDRPTTTSEGSVVPAWISIGLGVAAAGAGTYFAVNAISLKNDADRNCPGDLCNAQGASQNSDAIKSANYATVGFGVAALGVGLGAILFATRPSAHVETASRVSAVPASSASGPRVTAGDVAIGPGRGEVSIIGRW